MKTRDTSVVGVAFPPYELPVRDNGGDVLSKDERHCRVDLLLTAG